MYELNDIVAMLQNGATMDSIAAQMTQCLNDAKAEYEKREAEKKAAEEAARKQAEKAANRREIVLDLLVTLSDYCALVRPKSKVANELKEMLFAEDSTVTTTELDEFADQLDNLIDTFELLTSLGLNAHTFQMPVVNKMKMEAPKFKFDVKVNEKPDIKVYRDPIEEFLNKNVRK